MLAMLVPVSCALHFIIFYNALRVREYLPTQVELLARTTYFTIIALYVVVTPFVDLRYTVLNTSIVFFYRCIVWGSPRPTIGIAAMAFTIAIVWLASCN